MTDIRIALANLRYPPTPRASIQLAADAIAEAEAAGAAILCFPECYVPGYRATGKAVPPPDTTFLEEAWSQVAAAAGRSNIAVVLGTERLIDDALTATALVINADGSRAGFQDKVQIDPTEESTYTPGAGRQVFRAGALVFGIVICHEGWRYPETVRWSARQGAQVIFHPHFHEAEATTHRPAGYGEPANSFHEHAVRCRAAENTCYFASVNYASAGSPTTTALAAPDGTLLKYMPYGEEGLLVAEVDLAAATGLLAARLKPISDSV